MGPEFTTINPLLHHSCDKTTYINLHCQHAKTGSLRPLPGRIRSFGPEAKSSGKVHIFAIYSP